MQDLTPNPAIPESCNPRPAPESPVGASRLGDDAALRDSKLATARFYISELLPGIRSLGVQTDAGSDVVMAAPLT